VTTACCIEDLRRLARQRVPRMFFDYVESGSWSESTLRANCADLAAIRLRQRVAVDVEFRSLRSTLLGQDVSMPLALAPTGLTGMVHADGEILAAQAAEEAGVPFTLSTMSICSLEDVARHTRQPFWFQLYVMRDRAFVRRLIQRARAVGCSALVLTLDLPVMGQRHQDVRNGLSAPPRLGLANALDLLRHPRWCWGMLRTSRRSFGNIVGHAEGVDTTASLSAWSAQQLTPALTWRDLDWIKAEWGGKLVIKGVLDAEDARQAVAAGADALIVSNHGGRQLDGAPSSISALPAIVAAVGSDVEVYLDGGIRSGQDMLKCLASGAHGVMIGRAFLYGLGALGKAGLASCLAMLHKELDLSLALCGVTDVRSLSPANLLYPALVGRG
jgi:L-lactate dehydrogenase (cytochrome)